VGGLVLSALFMLRVVQRAFYGPANTKFAHLTDVPFGLGVPRMILAAVIVLFGLLPSILFDVIDTASVAFIRGLP
jgi:NADH-quinone oxidoreductase subunit M